MGYAKPIDVGTGVVCGSFLPDGSWLSIATVHPDLGMVELTGMPVFEETSRGNAVRTRRYRALMAEASTAFLRVEGGVVSAVTAEAPEGDRLVRLHLRLDGPRAETARARLAFHGRIDRPALAEITESDPPAPTSARTSLEAHDGRLDILAAALPAAASIHASQGRWRLSGPDTAVLEFHAPVENSLVTIAVELHAGSHQQPVPRPTEPGRRHASGSTPTLPVASIAPRMLTVPAQHHDALDRLASGALAYVRGCTALIAGRGERTILTDHRLLPLSWTRDGYWQALLLLTASDIGVTGAGAAPGTDLVADHLRWLWLRCERPDGLWVRSHHANGRRKDHPFQADQQLYPMLELADYVGVAGTLPRLSCGDDAEDQRRWGELVRNAWQAVERARDPATGLLRSDENVADDPAPLPLLASSQILGWYTARRLAALDARIGLGLGPLALERVAHQLRTAVAAHLLIEGAAGLMWAYAADGRGTAERYHDAGDLPTALAPLWGFCSADDQLWRRTMEFAFSEANPGYVPGPFGGLGSRHTPGTWPLGDLQEWVYASLTGDAGRAERVMGRLLTIAASDGMLPETYDPNDGRILARHWFAWPGATLAVLWLLDRQGRVADRLMHNGDPVDR